MKKDWIRLVLIALVFLMVISLLAVPVATARGGGGRGGGMRAGGGAKVGSGMNAGNINSKLPAMSTGNIGSASRQLGNNRPGMVDPGFSVGLPGNIGNRPGVVDPGFGMRPHRPDIDINVGGWGGYYPWNNYGYGYYPGYDQSYAYPYPVYSPVNYGNDPNACYQACVASGQYSPEQCAQMCYQPY